MYKVRKLWPSFKHFNFTRQMVSHVVISTLLLVGCLYSTAMNSRTVRTLMNDFKCYNTKLILCSSE